MCFVHRFVLAVLICNKYAPIYNNSLYFVLTKFALICNNNESHSVNSFQMWFIGICIFQVLPVKICSLSGYTLVDALFLEKHMYLFFQKQCVRDIPDHPRSSLASNIIDSFETYLGHSIIM